MTRGKSIIGEFNPDGRPAVEELKALASQMIDIINNTGSALDRSDLRLEVIKEAEMQILAAQMMAVKSLFL